jgi:sugar-phosphatase
VQPPKKFAPQALVLDMDGLMVDSEPLWYRVERDFAAARGGDFTHALALSCTGRGMAHTLRFMSDTFGFPVDLARDEGIIVDAFVAAVGDLELKPGCSELLAAAAARALPLALASSSPRRLIDAVLARFDLAPRFRAVVSGQDVASPKPAPDIFLHAAAALGVAAEVCAVLEDSLAGATAGRRAGMFVVAVPEGALDGRGFEAVADVIVPDLHQASAALGLG